MAQGASASRQRILEAARHLFLSRGFHGSNVRDIAEEASRGGERISMGRIYHHFASKEAIYEALLQSNDLGSDLPRVAALIRSPDFPDNLDELGRTILEVVRSHREDFKLIYIDILEFQASHVRPIMKQLQNALLSETEASLEELRRRGVVADVHPAVLARAVMDFFLQFHLQETMLEHPLRERTGLDEEEITRQLARILLGGVRRGAE